ncbi:hypothetical protein [Helicobacter pylori]|nr:hypothetical protein [Helicobacter pylori]
MFGSHDKLLLWIYPHNRSYGAFVLQQSFLKPMLIKKRSLKNH